MNPFQHTGPKPFKSSIRFVYLLLLGGCLTPIDFSTESIGGTLVVNGQVSSIQDQNIIQLGLTANSERLPFPLSGAYVALFDDTNQLFVYNEDPYNPGTYILPDSVTGIPGRTYTVQITSPNGQVYESEPEKLPEASGQVTTRYEIVSEDYTDGEGIVSPENFVKIYSNSLLPVSEEPLYFKWNVEETFLISPTDYPDIGGFVPPSCYIVQNADPQRVMLYNGDNLNTTTVNDQLVTSRIIDWTFLEKHYFTTYQTAMTKEAKEYWRKVNVLANQVGSIFDTPPAEITGNLRNINKPDEKVLGYFQAVNQSYDRFFILPDYLPFPLLLRNCTFEMDRSFESYPQRCLDCTTVRNGSYNRPDWF